jgi:hypothetical protein
VTGVFTEFSPWAWWSRPTSVATLLSCVPLNGSEPDAKVETLLLERMLHVCLEADEHPITGIAPQPELRFSEGNASLKVKGEIPRDESIERNCHCIRRGTKLELDSPRDPSCLSSKQAKVLGPMSDRWKHATEGYSFRFFSPEQIDRILREGVKRGRTGSHNAIERILKHEPGVGRAELWRQIRRLKQTSDGKLYQRTTWSPEDDQILRKGYEEGWTGRRKAVRELLGRHPGWQRHSIWGRAAKLGLLRKIPQKMRLRSRQLWTEDDDRILLAMAGYKTAEFIAKVLRRSENAVRYRLAVLGKSSRVHLEGYARRTLAQELHLGSRTIQRLIVQGLLDVRDPRITRQSLEDARKTGRLTTSLHDHLPDAKESAAIPSEEGSAPTLLTNSIRLAPGGPSKPPRSCRAKRIWADVATQLGVDAGVIEHLVFLGVLKLYDPRVTEKSLTRFCSRYGSLIKTDFLDAETRDWLTASMNLAPGAGKDEAGGLEAFRKHALVVRTCKRCSRAIRGNAFFRHNKMCTQRKKEDY